MRDLIVELKHLRLHGMAAGWTELLEQVNVEAASSQWLLERLLHGGPDLPCQRDAELRHQQPDRHN